MNDPNEPTTNKPYKIPELPTTAPVVPSLQTQPQKPRNRLMVALVAVLLVVMAASLPTAYFIGKNSAEVDSTKVTNTDTEKPQETDDPTDEVDEDYKGWKTFENETYRYTFKYPADWAVDRQVIQESYDWVRINPLSSSSSESEDVLAISTYTDGTGCIPSEVKEFIIGDSTIEAFACSDSNVYRMSMKHPKTSDADEQNLASLVMVHMNMGRDEDETILKILKSVTGLTSIN